ncbi:MAG: sulfur carrier protein ThiS adenylyltransferase ThiF [Bacillota bacterium]
MNQLKSTLQEKLGRAKVEQLESYQVGIIGAGGLGSNVAVNLVRSGFKSLLIADFDRVEAANLNRQFYFIDQVGDYKVEALAENLLRINPDLELKLHCSKVTAENIGALLANCDIIVEACDQVSSKQLVVTHFLSRDQLLVAASGLAGWGATEQIEIKELNENSYVVGDLVSEVSTANPPLAPKVNLVAAMQADLILASVMEGEI